MGFEKLQRATISTPAQTLGSTGGTIQAFPPVTVCTATATGAIWVLPIPHAGLQKTVIVDYFGDTGGAIIANKSTATVFNGTTFNIITVSSSQQMQAFYLTGVSSAQWAVVWSEQPTTSTGVGDALSFVRFSGSTIVS